MPSAAWVFGVTAEAGAQAAHTLRCRELSDANPSADARSGKFCFVVDTGLFLKCRIVRNDKAKTKGVPFQPVVANSRKSQPLKISCGRSLKMPAPCRKLILLHKVKWHAQDQQFDGAFRLGKKGPCLSLLGLLKVTVALRAGRDNATAGQAGTAPSNAPRAGTQDGLKSASDQQAA